MKLTPDEYVAAKKEVDAVHRDFVKAKDYVCLLAEDVFALGIEVEIENLKQAAIECARLRLVAIRTLEKFAEYE